MLSTSFKTLASAAAILTSTIAPTMAVPLDANLTELMTRNQPYDVNLAVAVITWYSEEGCKGVQDILGWYFVPSLEHGPAYDPDSCDPGLPELNNWAVENGLATLTTAPKSFVVTAAPHTCDKSVDGGNYLGAVSLISGCQRKPSQNLGDANFFCGDDCTVEGWSHNDGYEKCVNTPEYGKAGIHNYAITNHVAFCRDGQTS